MISYEPFPISQLPLLLSMKRCKQPTCLPGNAIMLMLNLVFFISLKVLIILRLLLVLIFFL